MQPSSLNGAFPGFNSIEPDLWDYQEDLQNLAALLCDGTEVDGNSVLLGAVERLDTFRGQASMRHWLHSLASTECQAIRGDQGHTYLDDYLDTAVMDRVEPGSATPRGLDDELLRRREFLDVFAAMSDSYRAALILKEGLGLTVGQCARLMDSTPASVRSMLYRARRQLR